jgi:hypothetical protein
MRAVVVMRSVAPLDIKPEVYSIGGYTAVTPDGREYSFDWDTHEGYIEFEEGHMRVKSFLTNWSDDFSHDNDKKGISDADLTAEFITKSTLDEVTYECYLTVANEVAGKYLPMELVSFVIEDGKYEFAFPAEEIARFNIALREYEAKHFPQASGE